MGWHPTVFPRCSNKNHTHLTQRENGEANVVTTRRANHHEQQLLQTRKEMNTFVDQRGKTIQENIYNHKD